MIISCLRSYIDQVCFLDETFNVVSIDKSLNQESFIAIVHEIFDTKFNPSLNLTQEERLEKISKISYKGDNIQNLTITLLKENIVRTNFYQNKGYISIKIRNKNFNIMQNVPFSEVFVFSKDFEGIHIRSTNLSRGGFRISQRKDYRTEVMMLAKTQSLKNSIIVPSGAKGGFLIKNKDKKPIDCYIDFVSGILDVVDNFKGDEKIKHEISYDEFDPYVVVAADKGTSSFSDTANELSKKYNFWLKTAFASGGSLGYGHKEIGITSLGMWECVKMRMTSLGFENGEEISCIAIGSPSGDVCGNGMLQYENIKIFAGISSKSIFIDPNPNIKTSFIERKRLFGIEAGWENYDKSLISKGGGIFDRNAKILVLSKEIKELFSLSSDMLTPDELVKKILCHNVDLILNGGIGTYFKSSTQTHEDAFDRQNDSIRVDANKIRARIIAEGGNLGMTHEARIEYSLKGGLVYGDFIDNSAGVSCSDNEVNLKILLEGHEDFAQILNKNKDFVVNKIKFQNFAQSRIIETETLNKDVDLQKIKKVFEDFGIEFEKSINIKQIKSREFENKNQLTRPETAFIISGLKMILKHKLSEIQYENNEFLFNYFGDIASEFKTEILNHKLKKNITDTEISSYVVNVFGLDTVKLVNKLDAIKDIKIDEKYFIKNEDTKYSDYIHEFFNLRNEVI